MLAIWKHLKTSSNNSQAQKRSWELYRRDPLLIYKDLLYQEFQMLGKYQGRATKKYPEFHGEIERGCWWVSWFFITLGIFQTKCLIRVFTVISKLAYKPWRSLAEFLGFKSHSTLSARSTQLCSPPPQSLQLLPKSPHTTTSAAPQSSFPAAPSAPVPALPACFCSACQRSSSLSQRQAREWLQPAHGSSDSPTASKHQHPHLTPAPARAP